MSRRRPQNVISYKAMIRPTMWIALFLLTTLTPACNHQAHDYHRYLNHDFPSLTKGVNEAVGQVNELLAGKIPPRNRATQMSQQVLPVYQTAINRLREYEGKNSTIHNYHQRYLAIAERQFDAFKQLRESWKKGQPAGPTATILSAVQKDMQTWTDEVATRAKEHNIELVDPQAKSP